MKIDFAARYKEVAGLLKASTKPLPKAVDPEFEQDLGSLIAQPIDSKEVSSKPAAAYSPRQSLRDPMDDIRASFKFTEPELQLSPMSPVSPQQEVSEPGTPKPQAVKTPTVFEVKRVELPAGDGVGVAGIPQLDKEDIKKRLVAASAKLGLDPALAQSVVSAESSFNVRAVSSDGHASKGLFQLLDSTGKTLMSRADNLNESYDPFNPDLNITLGTSYLRYLHDIFKTDTKLPQQLQTRAAADTASLEKFAVAAFNAGEGRVASAQDRSERSGKDPAHYDHVAPFLPRSTREYVAKVVGGKKQF
jgi:soluble lytic murein transglycosylase-like protein